MQYRESDAMSSQLLEIWSSDVIWHICSASQYVFQNTALNINTQNIRTKKLKLYYFFFLNQDASSAAEGDVFGLNGQIEHKLAFLRKHVPRETSLVLVGHSIGCYIILEMMKRNPELKVGHYLFYHFKYLWNFSITYRFFLP